MTSLAEGSQHWVDDKAIASYIDLIKKKRVPYDIVLRDFPFDIQREFHYIWQD
jgi:hypothetical protein